MHDGVGRDYRGRKRSAGWPQVRSERVMLLEPGQLAAWTTAEQLRRREARDDGHVMVSGWHGCLLNTRRLSGDRWLVPFGTLLNRTSPREHE
jgi:hypothetical protein